jgi:uncharacterized protein (DUF2237 family)
MSSTSSPKNVLGTPLQACCLAPRTGYFRDGFCRTDETDQGLHIICAEMTDAFLAFSYNQGNDLITPRPEWSFPGLKPGDKWCLCVKRWHEAFLAGVAPGVYLESCLDKALDYVRLEDLKAYAVQ